MKMSRLPKEKNRKRLQSNKGGKGLQDYAKYSGIAVQMIVIILVMTWIGIKLDKVTGLSTPVFTIIFSLLGVFIGIYVAVKDFIKW
jgi:F0F1-type ATP synthase assembly protein I